MKKTLAILLFISVGLNAFLIFKELPFLMGGGTHKQSPSKALTVMVNSLRNANPFAKNKKIYSEITIYDGFIADKVVKKITIYPINAESDMAYRNLNNPIEWNQNEKNVTVTTPDFTLIINMNPEQSCSTVSETALRAAPER